MDRHFAAAALSARPSTASRPLRSIRERLHAGNTRLRHANVEFQVGQQRPALCVVLREAVVREGIVHVFFPLGHRGVAYRTYPFPKRARSRE